MKKVVSPKAKQATKQNKEKAGNKAKQVFKQSIERINAVQKRFSSIVNEEQSSSYGVFDYFRNASKSILENRIKCLIVSDLDGTLLDNSSKISSFTQKVIKKAISLGHIFCIVTGRSKFDSIQYYKQLNLNSLICNINGANIWNPTDKSFSPISFCIKKENILALLESLTTFDTIQNVLFEARDCIYIYNYSGSEEQKKKILTSFHRPNFTGKIVNLDKNFSNLKEDIYSVLVTFKDPNNKSNFDSLIYDIKKFTNNIVVRKYSNIYSNELIVELTSFYNDKAKAVEVLSTYYNIPLQFILSFGDGENDKNMLKLTGISFAMKNAEDSIKNYSAYVTKYNNQQDGVARVLNVLLNLGIEEEDPN